MRLARPKTIITGLELNQIDLDLDHWFYNRKQMLEAGSGEP
jgi:hypothetical protein